MAASQQVPSHSIYYVHIYRVVMSFSDEDDVDCILARRWIRQVCSLDLIRKETVTHTRVSI